jgi:hypothetical protein
LHEYSDDLGVIEANRTAIEKQYGRERITEILFRMYEAVMGNSIKQKLSKSDLLDLYLDPRRLSLIGISDG